MASNPSVIIEFVADVTKLATGVKTGIEAAAKETGKGKGLDWKSLEKWAAVAGTVAVGSKFLVDAAKGTTELAKATIGLQRATGMEAVTASAWVQLLQARGIETNTFARSLSMLSRKMVDWSKAGEDTNSVLADLGVNFADVKAGNIDAVIAQVADAFASMTDPATKADAATRLFGKAGLALIPILSMGSKGIDAQLQMYEDYGATLDSDGIQSVKDMIAAQREVNAAHEGVARTIGGALLPVQTALWQAMAKLANVLQPVLANSDLLTVVVVALGAAYVTAKAAIAATTAVTAIQTTAALAAQAATLVWAAAQWVWNAAMAAGLWPILAVAAAIAGLIAVGYLLIKNWDKVKAAATACWDWIKDKAEACLNWIKANWPTLLAILTGPIGIAVLVISRHWDSIKQAAQKCVDGIKSVWNSFTSWFSGITAKIGAMLDRVGSAFGRLTDGAKRAYEGVKNWIGKIPEYLSNLVGKVSSAAERIANAIKRPINAVISGWNRLSFTIPSFKIPAFELPGGKKVGGQSFGGSHIGFPSIPMLARGGVLDSPTLFVGGEAGREIVTPEALLRDILAEFLDGAGRTYQLNLSTTRADSADVQHGFRRLELLGGR